MTPELCEAVAAHPGTAEENDYWYARLPSAEAQEALVLNNIRLVRRLVSSFLARYPMYKQFQDDLTGQCLCTLVDVVNRCATREIDSPTAYISSHLQYCLRRAAQQSHLVSTLNCVAHDLESLIDDQVFSESVLTELLDSVCQTPEDYQLIQLRLERWPRNKIARIMQTSVKAVRQHLQSLGRRLRKSFENA